MPEFRIQRCLGRGGFGEVYKGVMTRGNGVEVDVAVKVLRSDLDPESQGIQRLRDEGRLLGRMTHPSILRVYDLVVIDGHAALVSEYIAGDDLARILREEPMPPRPAFEMVAQVAAALEAAWSSPSVADGSPLHLVHRDIKPDNIRLDPFGTVKLLDFGLAQASRVRREAHTSVNTIMGSTQYLSPERLVQQEVGPEADVFALGATAYEALTGEGLFARKSMRQMYLLMIDDARFGAYVEERTASRSDKLGGPEGVALIRAAVSWDKRARPTAGELATRCDTLADSLSGANLRSWCRNRTWSAPPDTLTGPLEGLTFVTTSKAGGSTPHTQRLRAPAADPPTEGQITAGLDLTARPDPDPTPAPQADRGVGPEPFPPAPVSEGPSPWTPEEREALGPARAERSAPIPPLPAPSSAVADPPTDPRTGPTRSPTDPTGPTRALDGLVPPGWPELESTSESMPTQQLRAVAIDEIDEPASTARLPVLERQRSPELWPLPMAAVDLSDAGAGVVTDTVRTEAPTAPAGRATEASPLLAGFGGPDPETVPTVAPGKGLRLQAETSAPPATGMPSPASAMPAAGEGGDAMRSRRPRLRSDGTAAPRRRLTRTSSGEAVREITDEVPRSAMEPTLSGPALGSRQDETLTGHEPTWPALQDPAEADSTPARLEGLRVSSPPRPSSLPPLAPPSAAAPPPTTGVIYPGPPAPVTAVPPPIDEVPAPAPSAVELLEAMEATTGSLKLGTGLHGAPARPEDPGPEAPTRVTSRPPVPASPVATASTAATVPEQPSPSRPSVEAPTVPAASGGRPSPGPRPSSLPPAEAPRRPRPPDADATDLDASEPDAAPPRRAPPPWTRLIAGAGGGLVAIALGVGFLLFVLLVLLATRP